MPPYRVGLGYDIHRLQPAAEPGRLPLAGVAIPCAYSVLAHSDGDVVLHAVIDALLGALALGDIGEHFPDTDPAHANRASSELLAEVLALPALHDWQLSNVDVNIIAEAPRLGPHKPAIRKRLAELLSLPADCVGVKARSKEGCDSTGHKQSIEAQAVVLLVGRSLEKR